MQKLYESGRQSGWFGTINELASNLTFECDDKKQEFIDSVTQSNGYKKTEVSGLNLISYDKGRKVLFYEFNSQALGIENTNDRIHYYVLIDQSTNEVSLAIYDKSAI